DAEPFDLGRIAPTGRGMIGTVQDPIAGRLAGISGNAGLFSSVRDVARFAQLMLVGAEGMRTPVLADSTIQLFARRPGGSQRALGWDGPSSSVWAPYFSDASFGHTGYTGTSIWIDPQRDVFVVLLTNRTDPSDANQKHLALRRAVNALVEDDFAGSPPGRPDLGRLAAAFWRDLRLHAPGDPAYDPSAMRPAWFTPAQDGLFPWSAWGFGLGLVLTVALLAGTLLSERIGRIARKH
ncbi:MAG TPA: serine hydrolase, partial [Gemmatimonadales bacterium]